MYLTRPLSLYRSHPSSLSMHPPEGAHTGYLVLTDEETEAQDTYCLGACYNNRVERLPFPQDKILSIGTEDAPSKKLWFLPVVDKLCHLIAIMLLKPQAPTEGMFQSMHCCRPACTSLGESDMSSCCFRTLTNDAEPKPFDPRNISQQFKVHRHHGNTFFATSLDSDRSTPRLLKRKGWEANGSKRKIHEPLTRRIRDAPGLDASRRAELPGFDFPISNKISPSTIIGRWYCPFVFIRKEDMRIREQMRKTMLYRVTLEKHWEERYSCESASSGGGITNTGNVKANVVKEVSQVYGMRSAKDEIVNRIMVRCNGFVWHRVRNEGVRKDVRVGISVLVAEKMRMVEEEGGWVCGRKRSASVEEKGGGDSNAVLVEFFVFKRMDGSLVLKCEFRHTHRVKCKFD